MTVEMTISVPDEVASYLLRQDDASVIVTEALLRGLPEARRARQRAAALAMAEWERQRPAEEREAERALIEACNDEVLRGAEW